MRYRELSGMNSRGLFSQHSVGWKTGTKALQGLFHLWSLTDLWVTAFLMCPHMAVPLYLSEPLLKRTPLRLDSV